MSVSSNTDARLDEQPPSEVESSAWRQVVANLRDEDKTPVAGPRNPEAGFSAVAFRKNNAATGWRLA
jgi:hypothetical protein